MTLFRHRFFFYFDIIKHQGPINNPYFSAILKKTVDFNGFASLSIGGHLEFSTRLNLTSPKPCRLIMCEMCDSWMQWFQGICHLNASVEVNCGGKL